MKAFFISRIQSFGNAFRGWWHVIRTQQNAWIHAIVSTAVFIVGLWLGLPPRDWAVLLLTIAMVWAAEFFNTAIEAVVDLASPAKHPLAKVGKDVGAAAVLIAALAAIGVGLLILGPPLWEKMGNLNSRALESERSEELAFKGMELYSWQSEAGEWQYAILVGTNRNKTLDEVRATPLDLQEVKATIEKLAVGESLFWMNSVFDTESDQMVSLPFPSQSVMDELQALAREKQVHLYIP
jgi:diacylglycerol kinase (ATP)